MLLILLPPNQTCLEHIRLLQLGKVFTESKKKVVLAQGKPSFASSDATPVYGVTPA